MKKIMCVVLVVFMMTALCAIPAYAIEKDELSQKFYDYCVDTLPEDMLPAEDDKVNVYLTDEIDGITFFAAECWMKVYTDVVCTFGDTNVYTRAKHQPYELGIYALNGDKIYTLEEAYNSGWIADVSVLEDSFAGWYVFYNDYVPNLENKYESYIVQKVCSPGSWSQEGIEIYYREMFECFSEGKTSADEPKLDYALICFRGNLVTSMPVATVYGDYVLNATMGYTPFTYGYCIYIPETQEVLSLTDAYDRGIEGIEKVFTEAKVGRLMGDMDNDRKLTIKDTTYIQKIVAGFEDYSDIEIYAAEFDDELPCSIADFNRDGERNIKDATDLQKYLAGVPY